MKLENENNNYSYGDNQAIGELLFLLKTCNRTLEDLMMESYCVIADHHPAQQEINNRMIREFTKLKKEVEDELAKVRKNSSTRIEPDLVA